MRHTPSEKLEIIRLVEGSELGVRQTLRELEVAPSTFYRWYRLYQEGGFEALEGVKPAARRFWNRIPDEERQHVVEVALEHPDLSPRELAWRLTDVDGTYISESSVYRILKAHDLVTSPSFMVLTAHECSSSEPLGHFAAHRYGHFPHVGWPDDVLSRDRQA